MTTTAVRPRRPKAPLPPPPRQAFRIMKDDEVRERLQIAYRTVTGREKLDPRVEHHTTDFYQHFRQLAMSSGNGCGYITAAEIAKKLWPGKNPRNCVVQIHRHAQRLHAAGGMQLEAMTGVNGDFRCMFWRLLDQDPDPELYPVGYDHRPAGVAQSVRAAES